MKQSEKTIGYWIKRAKEIATEAHEGQIRNGGKPYIVHPERVAAEVEDRLKPIAWLHDVLEDTKVSLDDLRREFPVYIVNAVSLLTHNHGDSNIIYWNRILTNPDAVTVKLKDIKDNLADQPSDHAREKYIRVLDLFQKAGYSV